MKIGSLFSGIGGLELGLERAGLGRTIWQVEQDEYCRKVLAKHWPEARRYEDVRTIDKTIVHADIICGGFPCQDISNAGKRAGIDGERSGIDGERSGLWSEFARIIRMVRPKIVVVENVTALLGRGMGRVLGDLAACGYDAQWDCIPARAVGALHQRDRLFIVAHDNSKRGRVEQVTRQEFEGKANTNNDGEKRLVANAQGIPKREPSNKADTVTVSGESWQVPRRRGWWAVEPDVGRVAHGVPHRPHRLRALGNAVVPQVAEHIGEMVKHIIETR